MTRGVSTFATVALVAALLAAPASGSDEAKSPRSACDISGQEQSLGASYVTSLKVRNTSCGKGVKVVIAYNACRKANGGANSRNCPGTAKGFRCVTKVLAESPAQFNAKFDCRRGDKQVKGTYTQNI